MYLAPRLLRILAIPNRPSPNLILANSIKMAKLKFLIGSINYLFNFTWLGFLSILLVLDGILYYLGLEFTVLGYQVHDLLVVGDFVREEHLFWRVYQVHHGFGG